MKFRYEWMPEIDGLIRLKCFYGVGPNYTEFYIALDPVRRKGEFEGKEGYGADFLGQAFTRAMRGK